MVDCKNKIIVFDEVLVCLKKYVVVVTIQKKEKKKGKREDVFMATMQYMNMIVYNIVCDV